MLRTMYTLAVVYYIYSSRAVKSETWKLKSFSNVEHKTAKHMLKGECATPLTIQLTMYTLVVHYYLYSSRAIQSESWQMQLSSNVARKPANHMLKSQRATPWITQLTMFTLAALLLFL